MIFKRFFKPYAEYSLRTTLSEDELKNALDKEFPRYGFFSATAAAFSEDSVIFFQARQTADPEARPVRQK